MLDLISVCIPIYNGERYLKECINSVLNQSHRNIDILIIDDGSSDKSIEIVTEFKKVDSRIRLVINESNLGLVKNWNKCIKEAKGTWIKFLFQDDIMYPDCVEKMVHACNDYQVPICICSRDFLIEDSASPFMRDFFTNKVYRLEKDFPVPKKLTPKDVALIFKHNLFFNFIGEPIVTLFRKDIIDKIGYYNEDLVQLVDYEFILRACLTYNSFFLPNKLLLFRVHSDSESSKNLKSTSLKNIKSKYIEPLVMYHEYLFNPSFIKLKNKMGALHLLKLASLFYYHNNNKYKLPSEIKDHLYSKYKGLVVFKIISYMIALKAKI